MFEQIQERIHKACERAGRKPEEVKLVAVTKNHTVDEIKDKIIRFNHSILGENRIQEWRDKMPALANVEWHYLGNLQRNKVKYCVPFSLIHSVNSQRLLDELERVGKNKNHVFKILLELNTSGEDSKQGAPAEEADALLTYARSQKHIEVQGLMTMAPYSDDPENARTSFEKLRIIRDRLMVDELSMGMSGDFEVAIEEGATIIRIGSALFE